MIPEKKPHAILFGHSEVISDRLKIPLSDVGDSCSIDQDDCGWSRSLRMVSRDRATTML